MSLDRLALLLLLVGLTFIAGRCSSPSYGWKIEAEAHKARVAILEDQREALMLQADSLTSALIISDSVYQTDSIRWADESTERAAAVRVAEARADSMASMLEAELPPRQIELFRDYRSELETVVAMKDAEIAALAAQRAVLWQQREMLSALVVNYRAREEAAVGIMAEQAAMIETLQRAADKPWYRDLIDATPEVFVAFGVGVTAALLLTAPAR